MLKTPLLLYCRYLGKLFWPTNLAVFYLAHQGIGRRQMSCCRWGTALLLAITVLFFAQRRSRPGLLMGWLWFVGTLVPVIQLVQSGEQAMADRFTYLPLAIGICIIVVWGVCELVRLWRYQIDEFCRWWVRCWSLRAPD